MRRVTLAEFFGGDEMKMDVFRAKYLSHPEEAVSECFERISNEIASVPIEKDNEYWSQKWVNQFMDGVWRPGGSIVAGVNKKEKKISLFNCFSRDTEFVTSKGLKTFNDFSDGDQTEVLNRYGKFVPAIVKCFGKQHLWRIVFTRNGTDREFLVTPDHNWDILDNKGCRVSKITADLTVQDQIPYIKPKNNHERNNVFCLIGFLHGMVFGDGYYVQGEDNCRLDLCGDSRQFIEKILPLGYKVNWYDDRICIRGLPNFMKNFPDFDNINSEYLISFLMGWFAADGSYSYGSNAYISSSVKSNMETFRRIAPIVGIYTSNVSLMRDSSPFDGNPDQKLYRVNIVRDCLYDGFFHKIEHRKEWAKYLDSLTLDYKLKTNWKVKEICDAGIEEDVWCVIEPETHTFTLDSGIGTQNCTHIPMTEDSLEGIHKCQYEVSKAAAYRQGIGVDFSVLRPRMCAINNSAEISEGAVHWMKSMSATGRYVGQHGRHPALLFSLRIDHPDVEEVITSKDNFEELQNANISIQVTDEFMKAVDADADWEMHFTLDNGEVIRKTTKARDLFKKICDHAWVSGDPGVQFIDLMNRFSMQKALGHTITGSNACCFPLYNTVITNKGILSISEIKSLIESGEKIQAMSKNLESNEVEFQQIEAVYLRENGKPQKLIELLIEDNGMSFAIRCTPDHQYWTKNRGYVEASLLDENDELTMSGGNIASLKSIKTLEAPEIVGTLQVAKNHNYYCNGILVKNSEKPLPPYSVCGLASINMEMVPAINTDEFHAFMKDTVPSIVRYMDDVVEYELTHPYKSPIKAQYDIIAELREIGIGVTNLHKWLFDQGMEYDSDEAVQSVETFFKWYQYYAFKSSCELAKERGPCPAWKKMHSSVGSTGMRLKETEFLSNLFNEFPDLGEMYYSTGIRNAALLSMAPTGTLTLTFPTDPLSSGIEPSIGMYYWRRTRAVSKGEWDYYFVMPKAIKNIILEKIEDKESDDYRRIFEFGGSVLDNDGIKGEELVNIIHKYLDPKLLKNAFQIDPFKKIDMIARVQKYVDAAISVTFNVKNEFTKEDVFRLYMEAYKRNIKAITIFRDGSKEGILFHDFPKKKPRVEKIVEPNYRPDTVDFVFAPHRPKKLKCEMHKVLGHWVIVGLLGDKPYEMFIVENDRKLPEQGYILKAGKRKYKLLDVNDTTLIENMIDFEIANEEIQAITRLTSANLRHGVPIDFLVEQFSKCGDSISSYPKMVGRVLKKYNFLMLEKKQSGQKCPQCGEPLVKSEGCSSCVSCSYSKCE